MSDPVTSPAWIPPRFKGQARLLERHLAEIEWRRPTELADAQLAVVGNLQRRWEKYQALSKIRAAAVVAPRQSIWRSEPHRPDVPFLSTAQTKQHIDYLAHSKSLVVYAGAGVTIDRTGLGWADLIEYLLTHQSLSSLALGRAEAADMVKTFGPMMAASVAANLHHQANGTRTDTAIALGNALRGILYQPSIDAGARISTGLAELWLQFRLAGHLLPILTTNYDTHLSHEIDEVLDEALETGWLTGNLADGVRRLGRIRSQLEKAPSVKHLHGAVVRNGVITQRPIVSETDYFDVSPEVIETLCESFAKQDVLILGSSLQDPPLMTALMNTKTEAEQAGVSRIALVPRHSLRKTDGALSPDDAERHQLARFREQFGVTAIPFEFYSQVGQFLAEVGIATRLRRGQYQCSQYSYGQRLDDWWRTWSAGIATPRDYMTRQKFYNRSLIRITQELQRRLGIGVDDERLKIELWLRWDISPENRDFALCASSYAVIADLRSVPKVEIVSNSEHPCLKAFASGNLHYGTNSNNASQWRTFIAMPLVEPSYNLIVGTIVIASTMTEGNSKIGKQCQERHKVPLDILRNDIGTLIRATP